MSSKQNELLRQSAEALAEIHGLNHDKWTLDEMDVTGIALAIAQHVRDKFAEEFGVEPDDEDQQWHEDLMDLTFDVEQIITGGLCPQGNRP